MAKFKPYRIEQLMLFPNSINEYVPEKHLARAISNIVEEIDTRNIESKYSQLDKTHTILRY